MSNLWDLLIDPLLRGPTWGTILVCGALAAVGVLAYVRRTTQVGELISHAAYPGVVVGLLLTGSPAGAIAGAALSALIALGCMGRLTRRGLSPDNALALVLALFFGAGLLLASRAQFLDPRLFRQVQTYLYGQAPSMTDQHILLYAALALTVLLAIAICFKELQLWSFDPTQARLNGLGSRPLELMFIGLLTLSVLASLKAVGIVLATAMLVAPAVAARQFNNRLDRMLLWGALIGMVSGWLGLYCSLYGLPAGPMVALISVAIALASLLVAPRNGLLVRLGRMARFRRQCIDENILKAIWRAGDGMTTLAQLHNCVGGRLLSLRWALLRLRRHGWLTARIGLTLDGAQRAAVIVRRHRLWEAYLVTSLGVGIERVHPSAEEMEHILTPEVEAQLVQLLRDPRHDPHNQPIPQVPR